MEVFTPASQIAFQQLPGECGSDGGAMVRRSLLYCGPGSQCLTIWASVTNRGQIAPGYLCEGLSRGRQTQGRSTLAITGHCLRDLHAAHVLSVM